MNQSIGIRDIIEAVQRRWILLLILPPLGLVAAIAVALNVPQSYTSTAKILMTGQQIPEELARPVVTESHEARLRVIEQRLMTQDKLVDISDRLGLFADAPDLLGSKIADALRAATVFEILDIGSGRDRSANYSAFTVSFTHDKPETAAQVASEFVTAVLEQNLEARNLRATETSGFFRREVQRIGSELADLEARLAEFKERNESALPDSLEFRRAELARLREARFALAKRRGDILEKRALLRDALSKGVDAAALGVVLSPEEEELRRLERLLVQKSSLYTASHPDIILIRSQISAIKAAMTEEGIDPNANQPATSAKRQLEAAEAELKLLDEEEAEAELRMAELRESIARTPQVEVALLSLTRELEGLREQYRTAVGKRQEAAIGARLEADRQGERFEILEPAQVPTKADLPLRKLIALGGGAAGAFLAFGLGLLFELSDRSLKTPRDVERELGLRPLFTVPIIEEDGAARWRRWRRRGLIALGLLSGPAALAALHMFYMPLDEVMRLL